MALLAFTQANELNAAGPVRETAAGLWSIQLPSQPKGATLVVLLPGYKSDPRIVTSYHSLESKLLNALIANGYAVAVLGASGNSHWGRPEATTAALKQLQEIRKGNPALGGRLILIGESMGNLLARNLLSERYLQKVGWDVTHYVAIDPVMSLYAAYKTPSLTGAVQAAYPDLPAIPTLAAWKVSRASQREPKDMTWLKEVTTIIVASREDVVTPFSAQAGWFKKSAQAAELPVRVIEMTGGHVNATHFEPHAILPLLKK